MTSNDSDIELLILLDCMLRITYPNGDRLEFSTNGNCRLKVYSVFCS